MGLSENKVPQIRMVYYHVPVSKDYSWVTFSDTDIMVQVYIYISMYICIYNGIQAILPEEWLARGNYPNIVLFQSSVFLNNLRR
jgi:hypothetical protein